MNTPLRRYSMERRSAKVEATKARVRAAATALYAAHPEHFALKSVAEQAGTSVQTVLRIYGSKAALVASLLETSRGSSRRPGGLPEHIETAIRARYSEYEKNGDVLNPAPSEGRRDSSQAKQLETMRQAHRAWVEKVFTGSLGTQASLAEQARLFGLIVATDVSVWRLLRRDFGLYRRAAEAVVIGIITSLLQAR
jgi:AcrR family transcriptional regulator